MIVVIVMLDILNRASAQSRRNRDGRDETSWADSVKGER